MKKFLIITLSVCLLMCVLSACEDSTAVPDSDKAPTVNTSGASDNASQTETATETTEASDSSREEIESVTPEQTMGIIQEMIPANK